MANLPVWVLTLIDAVLDVITCEIKKSNNAARCCGPHTSSVVYVRIQLIQFPIGIFSLTVNTSLLNEKKRNTS